METKERLIDANALKESIESKVFWSSYYPDDVMEYIDEAPTVNAVDVVRCKDCTEWGGVPFGNVCRRWSAPLAGMKNCTGPDDYCSYGKRRTDNEVHSSDPCHL